MTLRSFLFLPLLILILFVAPKIVWGQQMIVDDATIAQDHIFEGWASTEESWVQPNLAISSSWNVNPGIIFNTSNGMVDPTNWVIENKFVGMGQRWALGNVSAAVFDFDGRVSQIYSYIPISRTVFNYNSYLHINLGIEANHFDDEWETSFTYGLRGDFSLSPQIILLSEVYSTNTDSMGFQAGLRFILIPGQLESDITYGQTFDGAIEYPGFNIGVSLAL